VTRRLRAVGLLLASSTASAQVSLFYVPIVVQMDREFAHEMRHLKACLDYLPKVEIEATQSLHAAIDTPRADARLGKVCLGEVHSLIRSAKRTRA
jgi:hypothetical protein